jgi:hypothetical protein
LPKECQDHVVVDGRDLIDARLAKLAFDVVLVDEAVSAVGVQADIARLPTGLGRDELRGIGFRAALSPVSNRAAARLRIMSAARTWV